MLDKRLVSTVGYSDTPLLTLTRKIVCVQYVVHARSFYTVWCSSLTLWRPLLPYGYSYKASCAKPSFVIFDTRALWRSALSVRVPWPLISKITNDGLAGSGTGCPHSCTHTATVGVKGLTDCYIAWCSHTVTDKSCRLSVCKSSELVSNHNLSWISFVSTLSCPGNSRVSCCCDEWISYDRVISLICLCACVYCVMCVCLQRAAWTAWSALCQWRCGSFAELSEVNYRLYRPTSRPQPSLLQSPANIAEDSSLPCVYCRIWLTVWSSRSLPCGHGWHWIIVSEERFIMTDHRSASFAS